VVFGYVMSVLTVYMSPFAPTLAIIPTLPITSMITTLILESIVMCASCYIPARRAGRVDPVEILRNL
jgi:ABC-type antimicrobial peptide transport system permease subunit